MAFSHVAIRTPQSSSQRPDALCLHLPRGFLWSRLTIDAHSLIYLSIALEALLRRITCRQLSKLVPAASTAFHPPFCSDAHWNSSLSCSPTRENPVSLYAQWDHNVLVSVTDTCEDRLFVDLSLRFWPANPECCCQGTGTVRGKERVGLCISQCELYVSWRTAASAPALPHTDRRNWRTGQRPSQLAKPRW